MSVHEQLLGIISKTVTQLKEQGCLKLRPPLIAVEVKNSLDPDSVTPELIAYASIQQIAQMTRKHLAHNDDPLTRDYTEPQQDMFSELLHDYYPVQRRAGGKLERVYIHRNIMTQTDYEYTCKRYERDIGGRQASFDAFRAWWGTMEDKTPANQ